MLRIITIIVLTITITTSITTAQEWASPVSGAIAHRPGGTLLDTEYSCTGEAIKAPLAMQMLHFGPGAYIGHGYWKGISVIVRFKSVGMVVSTPFYTPYVQQGDVIGWCTKPLKVTVQAFTITIPTTVAEAAMAPKGNYLTPE